MGRKAEPAHLPATGPKRQNLNEIGGTVDEDGHYPLPWRYDAAARYAL
jgi:hypothetical protein